MADSSFRTLKQSPLNSEPSPSALISSFLTPSKSVFHRNHSEQLAAPTDYSLSITSEVPSVEASKSSFLLSEIKASSRTDVVSVLACAGNRRMEMTREKETEGLQWGASALANTLWTGACSFFSSLSFLALSSAL
jgi:sulfite oxidase